MRLTRSRPRRSVVLALAVVMVGCARGASTAPRASESPASAGASFPVTITDDDGVAVTLDAPPERIVTFAPSATEIVFALGLGDRLVGVAGAFDDYPAAAKGIDEIGGAGDFGVDHNIETVGRLTGTVGAAGAIVAKMQAGAADVEARVAGDPAVSCFYEVYYPPLTTVGPDTFIGDLL